MPQQAWLEILIIKHGAFGDIVLASAALKAIRARHAEASIALMTTKPFASLLSSCPWVDEVWVDERSYRPASFLRTLSMLRSRRFKWVYDLQTSQRSSFYWWLMPWPKPNWSGIARFCSHRHATSHRTALHTLDRLREQLEIAAVIPLSRNQCEDFLPDVSWLATDISRFSLYKSYALLIPGGSAHRPEKRWPAERYAALASWLISKGIQPVLIGGGAEAEVLNRIEAQADQAAKAQGGGDIPILNLCNQTSYAEIATLARGAVLAVGNDTGPTHLIAAAGCPALALFSTQASNPDLCAPRGKKVEVLAEHSLEDLSPEKVIRQAGLLASL